MNVHLYTTDVSVFRLLKTLDAPHTVKVSAVIVPENRLGSVKVNQLIERVGKIPIFTQKRKKWSTNELPPANAAISWLYSQIIPLSVLNAYSRGIINMHGGRVPEYRGANVLQWAILNGETELGITWHSMVEEVDAGTIWAESTVRIASEMNALNVRALLIEEGVRIFANAWKNFLDPSIDGRMPDLNHGKVWKPRKPEDGRIYPGWCKELVINMVRALPAPWPPPTIEIDGAWYDVEGISSYKSSTTIPYILNDGSEILLLVPDYFI